MSNVYPDSMIQFLVNGLNDSSKYGFKYIANYYNGINKYNVRIYNNNELIYNNWFLGIEFADWIEWFDEDELLLVDC